MSLPFVARVTFVLLLLGPLATHATPPPVPPAPSPTNAARPAEPAAPLPSFWIDNLRELDRHEAELLDGWAERLERLRQRLVYARDGGEVELRPPPAPSGQRPAAASPKASEVGYLSTPGGRRPREREYLASGGGYNWLTLQPGLSGHYEVTIALLGEIEEPELQLGREAQLIVADAARDPDFYFWNQAAAHAQTPHDERGQPTLAEAAAMNAFVAWAAERTRAAESACRQGQVRRALYHLGQALHAVEDLAAHDGRTNAEHAWNAALGQDPDEPDDIDALLARARALGRRYWRTAASKALAACGGPAALAKPGKPWTFAEKTGPLQQRRDLTLESYCNYIEYGLGVRNPVRFVLRCGRKARAGLAGPYPEVRWSKHRGLDALVEAIAAAVK